MAKRTVLISDLTGQDIAEGDEVQVNVLEYPDLNQAVRLDAASNEAAELRKLGKAFAVVELVGSDGQIERIMLEADDLAGSIAGDADEVFAHAETLHVEVPSESTVPRQRRPRGTGALRAAQGEKLNYSDPENAGIMHRGRVTEVEAEWVRNNVEQANANRARAGQPPIDPTDEKEIKRYGFMTAQPAAPSVRNSSPAFKSADE